MYDPVALAVLLLSGACVPTLMAGVIMGMSKARRRPLSRRLARQRGGLWRADLPASLFAFAAGMALSAVLVLSFSELF